MFSCSSTENGLGFESTVRGYHYYRRYWSPIENETLQCFHESGNPFDVFAIKTCSKGSLQKMPATLLNRKLLERYREMVDHLYNEPEDNLVMGSFVFDNNDAEESEQEKNNPEKKRRKDEKKW